jgi:hypothetical protein
VLNVRSSWDIISRHTVIAPTPLQLTKSADDPTSFTPVGNSADSPELILRPSPATGHDAEIREGYDPSLCYGAANFPPVEVFYSSRR